MARRIKLKQVDLWAVADAVVQTPPIKLLKSKDKKVQEYLIFIEELKQAIKNMSSRRFAEMFSAKIPHLLEGKLSEEDYYDGEKSLEIEKECK